MGSKKILDTLADNILDLLTLQKSAGLHAEKTDRMRRIRLPIFEEDTRKLFDVRGRPPEVNVQDRGNDSDKVAPRLRHAITVRLLVREDAIPLKANTRTVTLPDVGKCLDSKVECTRLVISRRRESVLRSRTDLGSGRRHALDDIETLGIHKVGRGREKDHGFT